jgi:hypothetical protein
MVDRLTAKHADDRYESARALLDEMSVLTEKLRDGRRRRFFDRLFPDR